MNRLLSAIQGAELQYARLEDVCSNTHTPTGVCCVCAVCFVCVREYGSEGVREYGREYDREGVREGGRTDPTWCRTHRLLDKLPT